MRDRIVNFRPFSTDVGTSCATVPVMVCGKIKVFYLFSLSPMARTDGKIARTWFPTPVAPEQIKSLPAEAVWYTHHNDIPLPSLYGNRKHTDPSWIVFSLFSVKRICDPFVIGIQVSIDTKLHMEKSSQSLVSVSDGVGQYDVVSIPSFLPDHSMLLAVDGQVLAHLHGHFRKSP